MESIVNTASMYTLCYVDIVGSDDFFQSRFQCKSARALFFPILCSHNVEI